MTNSMFLTRHRDHLGDINLNTEIRIVGAGSIGSYATLALTKLGFNNIEVWDDGKVEAENIAPQFFNMRDIGRNKVDALAQSINKLTGVNITPVAMKMTPTTRNVSIPTVLVCAVDSMEARRFLALETGYSDFVDARMAIEFLTVFSFSKNGTNLQDYSKTLFTDENAVQEACTNKAISYTSLIAGGLVAKRVLDLVKNRQTTGFTKLTTINFDINSFDMIKL